MFSGHNNIIYGGLSKFLYKNGFYKKVFKVIEFRGNQKYRKHVRWDDIHDAFSPQLFYFDLFLMKQYIRVNPDV